MLTNKEKNTATPQDSPTASPFTSEDLRPYATLGLKYAVEMLMHLEIPMDAEESQQYLNEIKPQLPFIIFACATGV